MRQNVWKGLFFLVSAALMLSVGGCKGNDEPGKINKDGRNASVTFRLTLPQGEAYTYRAVHDAPEWTVKKLTLYMFNNDGSKLLEIEPLKMTDLIPDGEAAYSYTKEFTKEKVGVYRFLFVANDEVASATVGMSQADFEKLPMTQVLTADGTSKELLTNQDGEDVIPMTGVAHQGNSTQISVTGTTAPVQVTLTRVVARIDVANHIPNLTITKLSLRNTYDRTTTFPAKNANGETTYAAPADAQKVNMSAGFADLPTDFKGIAGDEGNVLNKAFYLYEGQQPEKATGEADKTNLNNATTIVVNGILASGLPIEFEVPFTRSSVDYDPITVRRNYLYTLTIGDNTPLEKDSKVVFTIEDAPWNSIILNHEMQMIEVKSWEIENNSCHFDKKTCTLYTKFSLDEASFQLFTRFENHSQFTFKWIHSDCGVEYKIIPRQNDAYYIQMPDFDAHNPDVEKDKAVFEIYSDAFPEFKRYLTIVYDQTYRYTGN